MSVRARATDRGEVTRHHILEVAAAAFAEKGYGGTSLNDVIRAAGVTKGGFYFHFPSKEALALEVLRYKQEQWAGRVVSATMRHEKAIDQLTAMPRALCDLYEQDPSAKSIGRICMELAEDRDLAPQVTPQFTTWIELTASLFRNAQIEGAIRDDVDPKVLGEMAVSTFVGIEMMSDLMSGRADLRERVDRFVSVLLTTLQPRKS